MVIYDLFYDYSENMSFLDRNNTTNETEDEPAFNPAVAAATMRNEEIPVELIQDKAIIHKLYCSLEDL